MSAQSFFTMMLPYAQQASAATSWRVSLILAQWANETQYGTSSAFLNRHNPAGIGITGPGVLGPDYPTIAAGVAGYIQTAQLSYYTLVGAAFAGGAAAQAIALGNSPWAGGHYNGGSGPGSALIAIINSYNLTQYDTGSSAPTAAQASGNFGAASSASTALGGATPTTTGVYANVPNLQSVPGFGPLGSTSFSINGQTMALEVYSSIYDVILERNIGSASTVSMILNDPQRTILNSGIFQQGDVITVDGLNFVLVQFTKQSDQLQLVFEAEAVYNLRQQTGATVTTNTAQIPEFAAILVNAIGSPLVAYPGSGRTGTAVGRGTSADPNEDSWTCLVRLAATIGWRFFESAGVFYLGPDTFWLDYFPSEGVLQEFTEGVQNMDFNYDVGLPYGNMTVTAMTDTWTASPGAPVWVTNMGVANGVWLVNDMQRDFYNPEATITLMVPMPPAVLLAQESNINDLGIPGG